MKNNTGKDRAIYEYFAEEQVPEQIHRAVVNTCANLPERERNWHCPRHRASGSENAASGQTTVGPVTRKRHTAWKVTASAFGTAAAAFLLLCGTNAVNPAFAESIPLIGQAFRQYNSQKKVSVGTYVGTYEGVSQVNSTAVGGEEQQLTLTAREAYSDGEYIHLSFTMDAPQEYLDKYYYLSMPLISTVNGEALEKPEYLNLWPEEGQFAGTAAIRLNSAVENGETLSLQYESGQMVGIYQDGANEEDLPGEFSGSVSLTADTSHNRVIDHFGGSGDIRIEEVEATPSYTKISYEIPFWGITSYTVDFPRLYTMDGQSIRRTLSESENPDADAIPRDAKTIQSMWCFDGLPNGTEQVILRFMEADVDDDMMIYSEKAGEARKAGVLGEVTIDLATQEAVPSETYREAGLSYAADFRESFETLNWFVGFDDIRQREGYPRQLDFFDVPDLFQNGIALEGLTYHADKNLTADFLCTGLLEKDLKITIIGEDGKPTAAGIVRKDGVTDNRCMLGYDSLEEMQSAREQEIRDHSFGMEEEDLERDISEMQEYTQRTNPGQYYFRAELNTYPGREPRLLDHFTVTLTDPDTGDVVYQRSLRFVRAD